MKGVVVAPAAAAAAEDVIAGINAALVVVRVAEIPGLVAVDVVFAPVVTFHTTAAVVLGLDV